MKRLMILLFLSLLHLRAGCPPDYTLSIMESKPIRPFESIWRAIATVESQNNANAYNLKENAVGLVQIRQVRLDDYKKKSGVHYNLYEMYDTIKAKEVFMFYAEKIGHDNPERISREWNGGERGMTKPSTKKYFAKVSEILAFQPR